MIIEKEAKFVNFKNNIISNLTKIMSEKIKTELKIFKIESSKHLSESLTCYKKQTNFLKEECQSKDMVIAKLSKTIENLTSKKTQVISRDAQTNQNAPPKELSFNLDGIQEDVAESLNTKQSKINLK